MSLLLALAASAQVAEPVPVPAPATPPAVMPAAFHGDWAPSAAACADKYARRIVTGPMNTEGDYWGVVKSVEALSERHLLVREGDDDFGVRLTADYVLSPDGKMLVLHVLERSGAKVSESPIPMVRCEVANG
ncbi:hypothetical protein [Novosphingobium sp.]|uniref:hypothetical protein n=1 Tax=Novosphingobium sp. TaxID=1874826 RepID=UPI00260D444C|nr:hypothetical protein [Novosphingobium sp.]